MPREARHFTSRPSELRRHARIPEIASLPRRNTPLFLTTTAKCDLTEIPIKIKLITPKALFAALNEKRIETQKVIVEFEEQKD